MGHASRIASVLSLAIGLAIVFFLPKALVTTPEVEIFLISTWLLGILLSCIASKVTLLYWHWPVIILYSTNLTHEILPRYGVIGA